MQIQNVTDYALKVMTDAGVEFVPFDSQPLNDVSANAWGAGTESYAYEDTETLARSCSYLYSFSISVSFLCVHLLSCMYSFAIQTEVLIEYRHFVLGTGGCSS